MERRAKAEAEERERTKIRVDLEGWRLLAVRAAERVGFWYTANLLGFGVDNVPLLSLAPPPDSIAVGCSGH